MPQNLPDQLSGADIVSLAHRLADAAGKVILPHFREPIDVANKARAGFDPVTEADRAAERAIRDILGRERPEDGIMGEEYEDKPSRNGLTWVLDPVDGTRAFIAGIPVWGTLIALNSGGKPLFGMIDQPFLKERYWGLDGTARMAAPQGERIIRVRHPGGLNAAILSNTTPEMFSTKAEREAFRQVVRACQFARFGCDCYAYAMVASGLMDLVIEADLKPYDIQAPLALIEAAGGIVTDWRGGPAHEGGQCVAAGDRSVHEQALELLRPAAA